MTTRLLLIRHGETNATATDKFSGDDNVHLSNEGREQVEHLARRMAQEKISAIYCSTADRATETAGILSQPHGLSPIQLTELREISHGHWEGLTLSEVEARFPQELAAWTADPVTFAPAGGESGISALARCLPAIRQIVAAHSGEAVMVVSHKGTLRLALCSFLGLDPREYRNRLDLSPASLSIVDFRDAVRAQLVLFNDVAHYGGHPSPLA